MRWYSSIHGEIKEMTFAVETRGVLRLLAEYLFLILANRNNVCYLKIHLDNVTVLLTVFIQNFVALFWGFFQSHQMFSLVWGWTSTNIWVTEKPRKCACDYCCLNFPAKKRENIFIVLSFLNPFGQT